MSIGATLASVGNVPAISVDLTAPGRANLLGTSIVLVIVGLTTFGLADRLASRLAGLLPAAATAAGAGTSFPNLGEALPHTIRTLALVAVFLPLAVALTSRALTRSRDLVWSRWATVLATVLVAGAAGLIYLWFATPPNMFPTNARIHWVDIYFDRETDYFYALVKVHRLVYDEPHLFQAALGAFNTSLVFWIARSIWREGIVPVFVALSFLGSSLMLLFAGTAEDVHLSIAPLLVAFLAHLERRPFAFGMAALVAFCARPNAALLIVALALVETWCNVRAARSDGTTGPRSHLRFLWEQTFLRRAVLSSLALVVMWNLALLAFGVSWIFGDSVSTDALASTAPREIDGFTISSFSGAYVLHLLWIGSPLLILANVAVAARLREIPSHVSRAVATGWVFSALSLALLEAQPLLYFNVRYLAYFWPFLFIGAWCITLVPAVRVRAHLFAAALLILAVAPATLYREDLSLRERVAGNPYSNLYEHRHELRRLAATQDVAVATEQPGIHNYVAYLLRRPLETIGVIDPGLLPSDTLVITKAADAPPGSSVVIDAGPVTVVTGDE